MNAFKALQISGKPGQEVSLSIKNEEGFFITKTGVINDFLNDGMIIDTAEGTEYIPAIEISKWKIVKIQKNHNDQKHSITYETTRAVGQSAILKNDFEIEKNQKHGYYEKQLSENEESAIAPLPEPIEFELLFSGKPYISKPEPCFDIQGMDDGIKKNILKWRNRFQYAQKVHEPARMAQDVASIYELAESLFSAELYFMAGVFADIGGLGAQRAKDCYHKAVELDHQPAAVALAALFIEEEKWTTAAEAIVKAICLKSDDDKIALVRALGQCLLRTQEHKVNGLGLLLSCDLDDQALNLTKRLIAITVKDDPIAYKAALNCDIIELRKTKIGNDLFPWVDEKPSVLKQKKEACYQKDKLKSEDRYRNGYISAFYANRNFGFIVENSTGQTWFFHKSSVESATLLSNLIEGKYGQDIIFKGKPETISGRYPLASRISIHSELTSIENEFKQRAPLNVRLLGIPKDGSYYAKAKEAEQLDQLEKADNYFYEEINRKGKHYKSAIKDLATLRNRMGRPETAIEVLDKYRDEYDSAEVNSLDQMKIQFFVKAKQYIDAAKLLSQTAKTTYPKSKKIEYLRQEAYCYFAAGKFEVAISKLEALPKDSATTTLLAKVKQALENGLYGVAFGELIDDEPLSSLALGLSVMARTHLDKCVFKGTDERSREKGQFEKRDYDQVNRLLSNIKGRRPRDRADYLISLAALCEKVPDFERHTQMHSYLMWYFAALAEAAMSENLDIDVVRCYCIESLRLHSPSERKNLENPWVLLLGTYLSQSIGANALLDQARDDYGASLFTLFMSNMDDWKYFLKDASYYKLHVPVAFKELERHIGKFTLKLEFQISIEKEISRNKIIENEFRGLSKPSFSLDFLRRSIESLTECSKHTLFKLDSERIKTTVNIYRQCAEYLQERDFREKEAKYLRLESDIIRILKDISQHPTILSFEKIFPILESLRESSRCDFDQLEDASPELNLRNILDNDFYVINNDYVSLRLLLESKNEYTPAIEAISLSIENGENHPCHSPEPLYGGQRREIELNIKPTQKQINDSAFTVHIVVEYRTRKGKSEKSLPFPIAVRLGTLDSFIEIPNPYGRYAGGSPVDEDYMFFGRSEIISQIINYITTGAQGQCFVIYGQKRSGKSSVLNQVEKKIYDKVFFVKLSAGNFTPGRLWISFARFLIQEMKFQLEDRRYEVEINWPSSVEVEDGPIEKIREVCRFIKQLEFKIVIAIDEFTYVYENAKDDVESFMRGWKALLEAKTFNAILVGQDTMPRFIQNYPNEFGFIHDVRLSYLNKDEAENLASLPILYQENCRYRGKALDKLFFLTAGNPYFLQITCDRLVRHLNAQRAPFVTEADIDQVARNMTLGADALPPERFDALVTAAGEKVDIIPRKDLWLLLTHIAKESLQTGWCYRNALSEFPNSDKALKDLMNRKILIADSERVRIQVILFTKWLQANQ